MAWAKFGSGPDAEVKLEVSGVDEDCVKRVRSTIETSIQRGKTGGGRKQTAVGVLVAYALTAGAGAAAISGFYLLNVSPDTILIASMSAIVLGGVGGLY